MTDDQIINSVFMRFYLVSRYAGLPGSLGSNFINMQLSAPVFFTQKKHELTLIF